MKNILQSVINNDYTSFREQVMPAMQKLIDAKTKLKEEEYTAQIRNRENLKESMDYKTFLKKKFAEHKIKSPFELSKDEQKKFWSEVKKEWAEQSKETIKESEDLSPRQKEYQEFFMKKLKKFKADSPAELSVEDKKKFFNEIESEWK